MTLTLQPGHVVRGASSVFLFVSLLATVILPAFSQSVPTDPTKANILMQWGRAIGKMGQPTDTTLAANTWLQTNGFGIGKSSTSNYAVGPTPVGLLEDFPTIPTNGDHYWHASTTYWTIVAVKTGTSTRWFFTGAMWNRYEDHESVWLPSPIEVTNTVPQPLRGDITIAALRATGCAIVVGVFGSGGATLSVYNWFVTSSQFYCALAPILGRTDDMNSSSSNTLLIDSMTLPTPGSFTLDCGKFFCIVSDNSSVVKYWGALREPQPLPTNYATTPSNLIDMPSSSFNLIEITAYSVFMRLTNGTWLAWGDNTNGWIAPSKPLELIAQPIAMPPDVLSFTCGADYCFAMVEVLNTTSGQKTKLLQTFGNNGLGQLGSIDGFGSPIYGSANIANATKIMQTFGGTQNIVKISAVSRTVFALLSDHSLWVWGANGDFYNSDYTCPANSGDINTPTTGMLYPQRVPLPAGCIPIEPPSGHGISYESNIGAINVRCYVANVQNFKSAVTAPVYAPIPGPSENYRQAIIAWGATAQTPQDIYPRPIDDFLKSTSTDTFHGLPMANQSVHSASLFAPYPYIMNLPMDYAWSKVQASTYTVFASGTNLGSTPSFDPTSPVNEEITIPSSGQPPVSDTSLQDIFAWGTLKVRASDLSSYGANNTRNLPVIPYINAYDATLGHDIYAAALKVNPGALDFATSSLFYLTLSSASGSNYKIDVGGYEPPFVDGGYPFTFSASSSGPTAAAPPSDTGSPGYLGGNDLPKLACGSAHCVAFISPTHLRSVAAAGMKELADSDDLRLCRRDLANSSQLPLEVTLPTSGSIAALSLGHDFTVLGMSNKQIYACGTSGSAALQGNTISSSANSTLIGTTTAPISSMASGFAHTLVLTTSNEVYSFGDNSMGQLGRSTSAFGVVSGLPTATIASVACVRHTSYAVLQNGNVYAWGENSFVHLFGSFATSSGIYSSSVPVLATLGSAMRLDIQVQYISSHPTARTVFAISKMRSPTATSNPPSSAPLIKFGIDPQQDYLLSPTQPTWYDMKAEIPTFLKSPSESIIAAATQYPISWFATDHSSIYFSVLNSTVSSDTTPEWQMFNPSVSSGATKFAPSPVFYGTVAPDTPYKIGAVVTYGALVGVGSSKCKFLPSKSAFTSPFTASVLNDCADFDCSSLGCIVVSSSRRSVTLYSYVGNVVVPIVAGTTQTITTSPITAVTMLSTCFTPTNSTSMCAAVALQNSTIAYVSLSSYTLWTGSKLSKPISQIAAAASYWIASDGTQMEIVSNPATAVSASLISTSAVCPSSSISSISATAESWYAICLNGDVYGQGYLPPQNAFLEGFSSSNSRTLTGTPWKTYLNYASPTKMQSFTNLRTGEGKLVSQIVGDRVQPSGYGSSSYAHYAVLKYSSSSPTPGAPLCSSSPPSADPLWYCDAGVWTYPGSFMVGPTLTISGSSPIFISGNLTASTGSVITITIASSSNLPYIAIGGCANLSDPIQIQLTEGNLKSLPSTTGQRVLILQSNANCSASGSTIGGLTAVGNRKGCKKWELKSETVQADSHTQLYAVISVTSNSCSLWWIILVSVVGGIIVLVVVALVVVFATPLRQKVLPYKDSGGHRRTQRSTTAATIVTQ